MSALVKILVAEDNVVLLQNQFGETSPVSSPWTSAEEPLTIGHLLPGNYLYFGASLTNNKDILRLHFLPLSDDRAAHFLSWNVSLPTFSYIDQELLKLDIRHPFLIGFKPIHRIDVATFLKHAKKYLNDLVIYQIIKYAFGEPSSARRYINQYAPNACDQLVNSAFSSPGRVHLLIIYNHNYSRNIPVLDNIYASRFSSVHHVLPNICPDHERCMSIPAGSYQYHYLIDHALGNLRLKRFSSLQHEEWVLVMQDDVMLHPDFSQNSFINDVASKDSISAYYHDFSDVHNPGDSWCWNERVSNACLKQADLVHGNGFEGMNGFFNLEAMSRGVGDIFAIRCSYISDFQEILGFYISQNLFPEVSISSSLMALCAQSGTKVHILPGIYLWADDRSHINSQEWMLRNFYESSNVFLHPVKTSMQEKSLDSQL
jgi:hypothetical protein